MRKSTIAIAICSTSALGVAHAQSSAYIYGIISTGVAYVSNENGHSNVKMISGTQQNSRWGFKIREDLGGGNAAIATLENGFDITSGAFQQGGRMFGRQAFVGLSNVRFGTLTFGRQYDMSWDYLAQFEAVVAGSGLAVNIGDSDNAGGTFRYNNSIKYISPVFDGFTFSGLYAASNDPGSLNTNNAFSLGAGYSGSAFKFGAVYTELRRPGATINPNGAVTTDYGGAPFTPFETSPANPAIGVNWQRIFGAGGSYAFGKNTVSLLATHVNYEYADGIHFKISNFDVTEAYQLTPSVTLGGSYTYSDGIYSGFAGHPQWHMGMLSVDYALSKRTDVYVFGVYQKALGGGRPAIWLFSPSASSSQTVVTAGIRHRF